MKPTLAALLALALVGIASPAAACGAFICSEAELSDDSYPPGQQALPPKLQEQVTARQGKGLSLAGFYNDPAVALARREPADGVPGPGYGYGHRWRHRAHVVTSPYGRRREAQMHHPRVY